MNEITIAAEEWNTSNIQAFWGEIASSDHMVQVYENEKIFLDTLEGFVGTGFLANDSVVIIATSKHLESLHARLRSQGFDLGMLTETGQYMPIDAEDLLSKFLVNDRIDEQVFNVFITDLVKRAKQHNGKIRAFGEMVAVLWEKGYTEATVQLEDLWNQLHDKSPFTLFCAYPKSGFTRSSADSIDIICSQHAKVIGGQAKPSTDIYYKTA